jgi:predicted amidohydrolase
MGELIADAADRECVIGADLDLESVRQYREKMPFLDDAM